MNNNKLNNAYLNKNILTYFSKETDEKLATTITIDSNLKINGNLIVDSSTKYYERFYNKPKRFKFNILLFNIQLY